MFRSKAVSLIVMAIPLTADKRVCFAWRGVGLQGHMERQRQFPDTHYESSWSARPQTKPPLIVIGRSLPLTGLGNVQHI